LSSRSRSRIVVEPLGAAGLAAIARRKIDFPVVTYAGWLVSPRGKRKLIAYGGLAWRIADRDDPHRMWCEMWFDIADDRLIRSLTLVRWAKRMLRTARQLGEQRVFVVREARPQSDKLLHLVGMTPAPDLRLFTESEEQPGEIWIWLASRVSEQP
jgi:hypothetical protein